MKTMYDVIKRQNGEAFAKAILHYDESLFDIPNFARLVKFAGRNALPILGKLKEIKDGAFKKTEEKCLKSPYELLSEAGYNAFYVDSLEKQNSIKKYFAKGESLCTFRDAHRFEKFHIIHAVKKNVDEIRREDFMEREDRQDEYGTSVISIQVLKTGGFISIKNRYNSEVRLPDNTFDSNPDNIIAGLSDSIKKEFNTDFDSLAGAYLFFNGMILNYLGEEEGVYCGKNFYLNSSHFCEIDKDKEFLVQNVLLFNTQKKKFEILITNTDYFNWYDEHGISSPVIELEYMLRQEIEGKKLQVTHDKKENRTTLFADGEMVFSMKDGLIDMLHLKKAECLNYFSDDHLNQSLKYYAGKKRWTAEYDSGSVPYTHLPKPPMMKLADHIKSQRLPINKQAGRQNEGD